MRDRLSAVAQAAGEGESAGTSSEASSSRWLAGGASRGMRFAGHLRHAAAFVDSLATVVAGQAPPAPSATPASPSEAGTEAAGPAAQDAVPPPADAPASVSPASGSTASPPPAATGSAEPPSAPASSPATQDRMMLGVNLAGAEFGTPDFAYGYGGYKYPTHADMDYFASKGMTVIRVPFLWERVQRSQFAPLDSTEVSRLDEVVDYAKSKGMQVVFDMHGYGSGFGAKVGSAQTPTSAFADFWGKMGDHFKDDGNVILGLMNEPYNQTPQEWLSVLNTAIASVRNSGAKNEILVSGSGWDGAATWLSSGNADVIGKGLVDSANNHAFEVHQYLDYDGSGSHTSVVSSTIGAERLADVTRWAEQTGNRLFLGEFGVAGDQASLTALDTMMSYLTQHQNVWQGATAWGAGSLWGDFSIEPQNGKDAPQMAVLQKYLDVKV